MGAGVLPFTIHDNEVLFLFQKTFSGSKVGTLIDFGGGLGDGEDYITTAIREFVEETETMYFEQDLSLARRTPERIQQQITEVTKLFTSTLSLYPDFWRKRKTVNPRKPKNWRTYLIEFPYRDVENMNREWENDMNRRFKKRRELVWISKNELLRLYRDKPEKLWKRIRQLEDFENLIHKIGATNL